MLLLGIGSLSFHPATAQVPAGTVTDTETLQFLGFQAGLTVTELRDRATEGGGGTIDCKRSDTDIRLGECRGGLPNLDAGRSVDLWASMIDGRGAVTTLSAQLTAARFDRWRSFLEGRYGRSVEKRQGPMTLLQWIRDGRMLRLSWRAKGRDVEASVSFVDGPLLDAWANQGRRSRSP